MMEEIFNYQEGNMSMNKDDIIKNIACLKNQKIIWNVTSKGCDKES